MTKNTIITTAVVAVFALGGGVYAIKQQDNITKKHDLTMARGAGIKKEAGESGAQKANEAQAIKKEGSAPASTAVAQQTAAGSYISYAQYTANKDQYKDNRVVLYFHAPWCPTCQALDKNIKANLHTIPANTVIVKTDYDSSTDLKRKYGVTYQHTLVQIDASGNKIKKWSGSPELQDVLAEIQA